MLITDRIECSSTRRQTFLPSTNCKAIGALMALQSVPAHVNILARTKNKKENESKRERESMYFDLS